MLCRNLVHEWEDIASSQESDQPYQAFPLYFSTAQCLFIEVTQVNKKYFPAYSKILSGKVKYEDPTPDLNSFNGTMKIKTDPVRESLTIENLLLRGCQIKCTQW